MKAVVLAAGKGTRLYPVTQRIAKPLLPVANRVGLEYAFDQIRGLGITDVCLVVGDNRAEMESAIGDGRQYDLRVAYAVQPEAKGLAHAMSFARPFVGTDSFIMYLGDAIYDASLLPYKELFEESQCANLNLVKQVEDPRRFGVATVSDGRIVRLIEKPPEPESNLAMAGVYFFSSRIWDTLESLQPSARGEYEITDAIQMLIDWGEVVLPGEYDGQWFDTGTLDSFLDCTSSLVEGGVLVDESARIVGELGPSTCVGTDAELHCRNITDATILPGAKVRVSGEIRHALVGGVVERQGDLIGEIVWGD